MDPTSSTSNNNSSDSPPGQTSSENSPIGEHRRGESSGQQSSASPPRLSEASDGYPSWLPKRPPPPAPASTFQSSARSEPMGGRKPTPRSVRIISMQNSTPGERREPTDQTRVGNPPHPRVWSRATGAGMTHSAFGPANVPDVPRPRFKTSAMHPELLQSPYWRTRLQFYLFPLFVFAHIPLQTFFDFNAVFILLQVSKFPNPEAPGVPGSGRNWALGAAAYIACWAAWVFVVFVVYEVIYSFFRRWRVKRPAIFPLYLSSSAYNFVSMTSYTNFCFMRHIRASAFSAETGSLRDGIAETCWYYSQNMPTVALLLPRAGLCLALLFAFSSPQAEFVALAHAGAGHRDGTFFRGVDGTLTDYARGVLIANAAWTAWRALVLICSWIGLWVMSGQACAGFCGPRYRWEEDDAEKRASVYSDGASETDAIPWNWREGTQLRVQEAYDFCLTVRPPRWNASKKEISEATVLPPVVHSPAFEGMDKVMAAVGFPSSPPPARRGVLSNDLFDSPKDDALPAELSAIIPKAVRMSSQEKDVAGPSGPLMSLPYPFTGYKSQISSDDQVPFPQSPKRTSRTSKSSSPAEASEEVEEDEDDEEEDEEEHVIETSEEPSSQSQGRTSGSMSSLGHPVSSRYPFQFRRPTRGNSVSSAGASHLSPHSHSSPSTNSQSTHSRAQHSTSTQSTGNRFSESAGSPGSPGGSSVDPASPASSHIPMPPRHPQATRGRPRAGTVPPPSPTPVVFPRAVGRPRARTRVESDTTQTFGGPEPQPGDDEEYSDEEDIMEQPIPEGPHEAAEGEDSVGLLSAGHSPRTSFVGVTHRPSNVSRRSRGSSQSGSSSSRSRTGSAVSRSRAGSMARSRTQSLIQSFGHASRSSLELVQTTLRSRANSSMARLEEDMSYNSDARSRSGSGTGSSNENHTFGQPLMAPRESAEDRIEEVSIPRSESPQELHHSPSHASEIAPSERPSQRTMSPHRQEQIAQVAGQPVYNGSAPSQSSHPDISTAAPSFITAPATHEGTSESSDRTVSSYAGISHMVDRSDGTWRPA